MFRIARYSSALAAGLLIAAFLAALALMDHTTQSAFAGVVETVKQASSVTFKNKQKIGTGPALEVKGYLQGTQFRWEIPGVLAIVASFSDRSIVELNLIEKTATGRPFPKGDKHPFANPIEAIQRAKAEDAKLVRTETIDGNTVDVFEMNKIDFMGSHGDGTTTVWVDRETSLPTKIVIDDPGKQPGSSVHLEFDSFVWNQQLGDELFRIPDDFTFKGLIDNSPQPEPAKEAATSQAAEGN